MRSAAGPAGPDPDRTARARIRDAAITCFAETGISGTTVRAIAARAGVSPGLVIHHFGSKTGLRQECDASVARRIHEREAEAMTAGGVTDPLGVVRDLGEDPPVLRYLARTLADDSPEAAGLVDQLVEVGVDLMRQAVDGGMVNPTDDEYARTVVLSMWSFGALVMHRHLQRLLDVDLLGDPTHATRYITAVLDVLTQPVFGDVVARQLRAAFPTTDDGSRSTTA